MSQSYVAKSTFMGLISKGKFAHLWRPWKIEVDIVRKRVNVSKRNWYLINVDEDTFQFGSVRHIQIDNSLFGADLHIKMYSGTASVYAISKRAARQIREMLLN